MSEAPDPEYKPNQWVKFKFGSGQGISQVKGAMYDRAGSRWLYKLSNPMSSGDPLMVPEKDIIGLAETKN